MNKPKVGDRMTVLEVPSGCFFEPDRMEGSLFYKNSGDADRAVSNGDFENDSFTEYDGHDHLHDEYHWSASQYCTIREQHEWVPIAHAEALDGLSIEYTAVLDRDDGTVTLELQLNPSIRFNCMEEAQAHIEKLQAVIPAMWGH